MADIAPKYIASRIMSGQTVVFNYPAGQSVDDYVGALDHELHHHQGRPYRYRTGDFTLAWGVSSVTLTPGPGVTLEAGGTVWLHLARRVAGPEAVVDTLAQVAVYKRPTETVTLQALGGAARYDGGGGRYAYDPLDSSTAASSPDVLVGAEGARWKRIAGSGGGGGSPGASAYQVAVNNGFVGTESAWLASLHGEDGEDGTDGASLSVVIVASADDIPDPPAALTFYAVPAA